MDNYQTTETISSIQISLESILYLCDDSPVGGAISTYCRFNIFGMFCADRTVWLYMPAPPSAAGSTDSELKMFCKKLGQRLCFQSCFPVMVFKSIKHVIPEGYRQSEAPHLPTIIKKRQLGKVFYNCDALMKEQIWWRDNIKLIFNAWPEM